MRFCTDEVHKGHQLTPTIYTSSRICRHGQVIALGVACCPFPNATWLIRSFVVVALKESCYIVMHQLFTAFQHPHSHPQFFTMAGSFQEAELDP